MPGILSVNMNWTDGFGPTQHSEATEISRQMQHISQQVSHSVHDGSLRDLNGKYCGEWTYTPKAKL